MKVMKNHLTHFFLIPWDHTGEVPFNQRADEFIKENRDNIAYIEEAAVSMYGMKWYGISVCLIKKKEAID